MPCGRGRRPDPHRQATEFEDARSCGFAVPWLIGGGERQGKARAAFPAPGHGEAANAAISRDKALLFALAKAKAASSSPVSAPKLTYTSPDIRLTFENRRGLQCRLQTAPRSRRERRPPRRVGNPEIRDLIEAAGPAWRFAKNITPADVRRGLAAAGRTADVANRALRPAC